MLYAIKALNSNMYCTSRVCFTYLNILLYTHGNICIVQAYCTSFIFKHCYILTAIFACVQAYCIRRVALFVCALALTMDLVYIMYTPLIKLEKNLQENFFMGLIFKTSWRVAPMKNKFHMGIWIF